MRYFQVLTLILVSASSVSQSWQWSQHIGGEGTDAAMIGGVDAAGNVYLHGMYAGDHNLTSYGEAYIGDDTLHGSSDSFLAKYAADGTLLWVRDCASPSGSLGLRDMVLDEANDVLYMTGGYEWSCSMDTCALTAPYCGAFLAKWTTDGACLWAKNIGTSAFQPYSFAATTLTLDPAGYIFLSGVTSTQGPTTVGSQTLAPGSFIARYDLDGNEDWSRQFVSYQGLSSSFSLSDLESNGTDVIGYGSLGMFAAEDVITIDTVDFTGSQGSGFGLIGFDPVNGTAKWLHAYGFPNDVGSPVFPERMCVDGTGNIYCTGSYIDTAFFAEDTLLSASPGQQAYLARFEPTGELTWVKEFNATQGIISSNISMLPDGSVYLTGAFAGSLTMDGYSTTAFSSFDLFISRHSSMGICGGLMNNANGLGRFIAPYSGGLYLAGIFPPNAMSPPFAPITIGDDTYDSHGWEDIFLAKHDLITSTPPSMVVEDDGLEIYANPNRGSFRLRLPTALANAPELLLRIYNSSGQLVREQQLQMDEERPRMDVWDVGPGLYNVTVTNGRRTYSGSMVVE